VISVRHAALNRRFILTVLLSEPVSLIYV
jgi:hypothetical protein